jgi:ribosomal protein S18 acetylase RimI-like enzyme
MGLTYFKRYRMEFDLSGPLYTPPELPAGYLAKPWQDSLLDAHAEAKYESFCIELDANVFPCLGQREGCRRLMREIAYRQGFLGEATWLMQRCQDGEVQSCGTIQGVRDSQGYGAVQNLGITPSHRGQGLGTHLLFYALRGFQGAGLQRAFLEVTAQNVGAVRLYRRLGFRCVRTVYKAGEVAYA